MKAIPQIHKYMTTTPHSISADETLFQAFDIMKKYEIRHLPVMKNGKLCGVLTDRDLKLAMSLQGVKIDQTRVMDIATEDPHLTTPSAPLDEVVTYMAEHKIGSTLVVDHHKLVGIFTSTDAMRVLGEIFHTRLQ